MADDKGSFLICVHCGKGVGEGLGEDCFGAKDTMHDFQDSRAVAPSERQHELEAHCVTEVNGAGVQRETWQECSVCRETFGENDYIGPCMGKPPRCTHKKVSQGWSGDEGYIVICDDCGEDLTPSKVAPSSEQQIPADLRVKAIQYLREEIIGFNTTRTMYAGTLYDLAVRAFTAEERIGRAEDRIAELGETIARRESMLDRLSESNDNQLRRIAELEGALTRLRDCDWVISLPDRMDAVRDIARAALAAPSGGKP